MQLHAIAFLLLGATERGRPLQSFHRAPRWHCQPAQQRPVVSCCFVTKASNGGESRSWEGKPIEKLHSVLINLLKWDEDRWDVVIDIEVSYWIELNLLYQLRVISTLFACCWWLLVSGLCATYRVQHRNLWVTKRGRHIGFAVQSLWSCAKTESSNRKADAKVVLRLKLFGIVSIPVAGSCKLDPLVPKKVLAAAISAHPFSTFAHLSGPRYREQDNRPVRDQTSKAWSIPQHNRLSVSFHVPWDQFKSDRKTLLMDFENRYR